MTARGLTEVTGDLGLELCQPTIFGHLLAHRRGEEHGPGVTLRDHELVPERGSCWVSGLIMGEGSGVREEDRRVQ